MRKDFELSREQVMQLVEEYGTPLYVYDEEILRTCCKEMKSLVKRPCFRPHYSAKANSNIELLKIIRSEGFCVDAISPGEIVMEEAAGFLPEEMLFITNNISVSEMQFAMDRGIMVSVDSLSQLETFGQNYPGKPVAVRLNPGIGDGHNKKVVTGGQSKFGIMLEEIGAVKAIARKYQLTIAGINQHIGSLFLEGSRFIDACRTLFAAAREFEDLEFVDLGGGFGVPYRGEERLDLAALSLQLESVLDEFLRDYPNQELKIKIEPGRYVAAECGILIGQVNSIKVNYGEKYVGTDLGFNVLMRPVLYDSYHEIEVYGNSDEEEKVTVVGNICETGDILAKERLLAKMEAGDYIAVHNAGAYGYSMSSNYNGRLRPAEVLLQSDGSHRLIRRRDTLEDLVRQL